MEKEEDGDNDRVVGRWEIVVVNERETRKGGGSWRTGTRREDSGIYLRHGNGMQLSPIMCIHMSFN
jgi:hypothetical protein